MIITFIVGCVLLGIFLAFLIAPIVMITDSKKLKEIQKKIDAFENYAFSTPEAKEKYKQSLKKELIKIKAKIFDKRKKEEAGDKISLL